MAFGPPGNSHNGEIWWLLPNEIGTSAAVVENPPTRRGCNSTEALGGHINSGP